MPRLARAIRERDAAVAIVGRLSALRDGREHDRTFGGRYDLLRP
jgi:hypothetical protein